MSEGPAPWLFVVRVDPRLVREDVRLRARDLTLFVDDLVATRAGRRSYLDAAEEFLREARFDAAAGCIEPASPQERASIDDRLRGEWARVHCAWVERRAELRQALSELRKAGVQADDLADASKQLDDALEALPTWTDTALLSRLRGISREAINNVRERIDWAQLCLDETQRDRERIEQAREQELLDLKARGDAILTRLSQDRGASVEQKRWRRVLAGSIVDALADRDFEVMSRTIKALEGLERGELPPEDGVSSTPGAAVAERRSVPPPRPVAGGERFDDRALSRLSEKEVIERLKDTRFEGAAPAERDALWAELLREWSREQIDEVQTRIVREMPSRGGEPAKERVASFDRVETIGALLLSRSRAALLDQQSERATLLSIDALRWGLSDGVSPRALGRYRDASAWGLLHSIVQPFVTEAWSAARFDTESRDLRGAIERLDTHGLFPELAVALLDLGPYGALFFDAWIAPFVADNHLAARALVIGLVENLLRAPLAAWRLIVSLVKTEGVVVPTHSDAELSGDPPLDSSAYRAWRAARFDLLKDRLLAVREQSDLADDALDALERVELRLDRGIRDGEGHVALSLLTPEVATGAQSRVVIRLTSSDGRSVGIRNVRPSFKIEGEGASELTQRPIAWLPKDVPVELSVPVSSTKEGVANITVSLLRLSAEGTRLKVPTRISNLSFDFVAPYAPPENPYILRSAVSKASQVFGRDAQIGRVLNILRGANQLNPVLVLGARRIGKTSFLNAMRARREIIDTFAYVVSIDFQSVPARESLETFFLTRMMRAIQEKLPERMLVPIREERVKENPHTAFTDFMDAVENRLHAQGKRLLLVVDELEKIASAVGVDGRGNPIGIGEEVLASLRAAMQRSRRVGFLLAGATDGVRRYQRSYHSRLFQIAEEVELPPLDDDAAGELIRRLPEGVLKWRDSAVGLVVRETAGDPSLIQALCFRVFQTLTARSARWVTVTDVDEALADFVTNPQNFLALAEGVEDAVDRQIVRVVAELQADPVRLARESAWERRWVRRQWIAQELSRRKLPIEEQALSERLERLCREVPNVLTRNPAQPQRDHRISAGLYARHLVARRPRLQVR